MGGAKSLERPLQVRPSGGEGPAERFSWQVMPLTLNYALFIQQDALVPLPTPNAPPAQAESAEISILPLYRMEGKQSSGEMIYKNQSWAGAAF